MKNVALALVLAVLTACASAPVQEMSDARQAVMAAQAAGAAERAPVELAEAQQLIEEAQRQLQRRDYGKAQRMAINARKRAVKALEVARQSSPDDH
jgi:tRNA A37 N6-isopentenylltransferase MiaA